jgi:exosortase/archaeosortase family protein
MKKVKTKKVQKNKKQISQKINPLNNKNLLFIFSRYFLGLALAINNLYLFYLIFTPLTVYPLYLLLSLIYEISLSSHVILIENFRIVVVDACIAGAAYYLLTLLNLFVKMPLKKRIKSLLFSYFVFWLLNITRLFIFSVLFVRSFSFFNILHLLFWYVLSGVLVFLVWILTIKKFKITSTPVIDDFKPIFTASLLKKK